MDIAMPIMDGYQATMVIRDMEKEFNIKNKDQLSNVIGLTGHCADVYKDKCFDSGMNLFSKLFPSCLPN
jgi:CheY-like chemotaxis protein